ncbi:hypothetical protein D3C81_1413730 [compost metagenome]
MPGSNATKLFGRVLEADVGQQVTLLLQALHRLEGHGYVNRLIQNAKGDEDRLVIARRYEPLLKRDHPGELEHVAVGIERENGTFQALFVYLHFRKDVGRVTRQAAYQPARAHWQLVAFLETQQGDQGDFLIVPQSLVSHCAIVGGDVVEAAICLHDGPQGISHGSFGSLVDIDRGVANGAGGLCHALEQAGAFDRLGAQLDIMHAAPAS